jgi:hypothetical protein
MTAPLIDITYAELRDDDVLVDKSGGHWLVSGVEHVPASGPTWPTVTFWLCDPRTRVRLHHMTKPAGDPCKVERVATHADDVAALEAGSALPDPSQNPHRTAGAGTTPTTMTSNGSSASSRTGIGVPATTKDPGVSDPTSSPPVRAAGTPTPGLPGVASPEEDARRAAVIDKTFTGDYDAYHDDGVAAAAAGLGATVDVDLTAAQVDEARKATDDDPVEVALFESMTDLEQRSHLFVLHGLFADDLDGRVERQAMHVDAHREQAKGKLYSLHRPHVHSEKVTA